MRLTAENVRPLAERMRPLSFDEMVGQAHLVGPNGPLRHAVEQDRLYSIIFWGPPGCGKTTLARIIATHTRAHFAQFSAVLSGVKQIRQTIEVAREQKSRFNRPTILFVDEIHRFNKSQQDAFLHHVEEGLLTLIGATTENPSFEINAALLSRCRVYTLKALGADEIALIIRRALDDSKNGLGNYKLRIDREAETHLIGHADGDVRRALNGLEAAAAMVLNSQSENQNNITLQVVEGVLQQHMVRYDKAGEEHYNLISALHKSLRDSDPDAAFYWLERMLVGGEDPLYIARRMVRFASEDIGLADPYALGMALQAMESYRFLGSPEGELALLQAAVYLATAPKSNRLYMASKQARRCIRETGSLGVPLHLRNAPTKLMKELDYGKNYQYAHDHEEAVVNQSHLPKALEGRRFYRPTQRGFEKTIQDRMRYWQKIRARKSAP